MGIKNWISITVFMNMLLAKKCLTANLKHLLIKGESVLRESSKKSYKMIGRGVKIVWGIGTYCRSYNIKMRKYFS